MNPELHQKARKQKVVYRIADLLLKVVLPIELKTEVVLPSFETFKVGDVNEDENICSIELVFSNLPEGEEQGKLLSDRSVFWAEHFRFYERDNSYITTILNDQHDGGWEMKSTKDFSQSVIYLSNAEQAISNALSWLIMVAFGQTCLLHQVILIHASVIEHEGNGYAFLGKSGTGKSTHSRLWIESIAGSQLLNDDNPAIRMTEDGQVYIYGTPWSGKTACYKNSKVTLAAFVRLKQAKRNQITFKKWTAAFVAVLPSCTGIRWNKDLFSKMNSTLEAVLQNVLVAELECLPNQDAARLCYQEIDRKNNFQYDQDIFIINEQIELTK